MTDSVAWFLSKPFDIHKFFLSDSQRCATVILPSWMTEKQETTYSMEQRAKLWAVGGGKGGVGKSTVAMTLGLHLQKE